MLKSKLLQRISMKYLNKFKYYSSSPPILQVINQSNIDNKVEVKGWVKAVRKMKENIFIDIGDGSTDKKLQILISPDLKPTGLSTGASIKASGVMSYTPKGQLELKANNIEVFGECPLTGYPFAPRKQYTAEYVRQFLHFRPRTNRFGALLRIRNAATLSIHNYLNSLNYININTPILTSNDCEGAGELFTVIPENRAILLEMKKEQQPENEAYFNTKAFLTVSGQMHLEAAAHGLSKVYTFGPTFRAENSKSRLHLSEFYMLEAEVAFIDKLDELVDIIEQLIKSVTKDILEKHHEDIARCSEEKIDPNSWLDKPFARLSFEEASTIVENSNKKFSTKFEKSRGFGKEHELFLVEHCGGVPVFVVNWPKSMKPFYMKEIGNDQVAALDLLGPIVGEVVGGSLRENDYETLSKKIPNNFDWYLDLRKYGGVSTGGFGLGFERYLQMILGVLNIKDVIPFPRWPHNCSL